MIYLFVAIAMAIIFFIVFKILGGENERIRTLLRIYKAAKNQKISEDETLALVIEEHILSSGGVKLGKTDITGTQYISNVFEGKEITIHDLIKHIICLEFPKKYRPYSIDIDAMREHSRKGIKSPDEILREKIHKYHSKYLS